MSLVTDYEEGTCLESEEVEHVDQSMLSDEADELRSVTEEEKDILKQFKGMKQKIFLATMGTKEKAFTDAYPADKQARFASIRDLRRFLKTLVTSYLLPANSTDS